MKLRITAMITALCMTLGISGCTNQATIAALVTTLGNSAAAIATIEGNPDLGAKLKVDTAAAAADVLAWKTGSPAQNAIQAIQLVEDDLNLFPITSKYAILVTLALGTAQSIIQLLNPSAVPMTARLCPDGQPVGCSNGHRTIQLANPPKTAAQFKKQFNTICDSDPALASVRIN